MKLIYQSLFYIFLVSCSSQGVKTVAVPVVFDSSENATSYSFSKNDYFYHIANLTIASDNMDLLFVIRIPKDKGVFDLNPSSVYLADFRGCRSKASGVSLYRGNDIATDKCDAEPPRILPNLVAGEVTNNPKSNWLTSYEVSIENVEFYVGGELLIFKNLSGGVKNINYYGP